MTASVGSAAGLALNRVDVVPDDAVGVGPLGLSTAGVANVVTAFGTRLLAPGIAREDIGIDGVVGRPSCSMDSDMIGISIIRLIEAVA